MSLCIALLGFGTVGRGIAQLLLEASSENHLKVVVRDLGKAERFIRDQAWQHRIELADMPKAFIEDPEVKVVIELMGGIDPAYDYIEQALNLHKPVVTANKALLAEKGHDLFKIADQKKTGIYFEAAVGGAIPIINVLYNHLAVDQINSIAGILNGTSHFILTKMAESQWDFQEALDYAKRHGYAESDPSQDVKLFDACHKLTLLSCLAFNKKIDWRSIPQKGIEDIRYLDLLYAEQFDSVIKPIAKMSQLSTGELTAHVEPMLVPKKHVMAHCEGVSNAIVIQSAQCGASFLMGAGAGQLPTATAVMADVNRAIQQANTKHFCEYAALLPKESNHECAEFYIRLIVRHEVGILSELTEIFSRIKINIKAIYQKEDEASLRKDEKTIVIMTEGVRDQAIADLEKQLNAHLQFAKCDKLILRFMEVEA